MKQLLIASMTALSLLATTAISSNVEASSTSDWISGAMGAANPSTSNGNFQSSDGTTITPQEFLPEPSQEDRDRLNQAESSYGDDGGLLGLANTGNQSLASQGDSTKPGMAFEIVNQPIGFETTIEHKIYQSTVTYEHDVNSPLNTNYLGFAWVDRGSRVGSESGGGDNFFITPIPSGKSRILTAMFAVPIRYPACERNEITITGGAAWIPGCSSGNCQRTIQNPMESSLHVYGAYQNRYWYWVNGDGSEGPRMRNSEGGINVAGHALEFPRITERDKTNLSGLKHRFGVRKVEETAICNHPFPSEDPYYIESLPSCDDASLQPGDECGNVTRNSVDYEANPFSGPDMQQQLSEMLSDCQVVDEEVTSDVTITKVEEQFCAKSSDTTFQGCTLTHSMNAQKRYEWVGTPPRKVERIDVTDSWNGTAACKNLMAKVSQYDSACTYTKTASDAPRCRTVDGIKICEGDQAYDDLTAAPGGAGNKLSSSVTISDVNCDVNSGTVNYEGTTIDLEPYNTCTEVESNPKCTRVSKQCVNETSTDIGSWCSEYEFRYECEEEITAPSSQTNTKLVCEDQEFYCKDGSCLEQQDTLEQSGFAEAAATLSAIQGIASHTECQDPQRVETCQVFNGKAQACRKGRGKFADLWNCCDLSGGEDALEEGKYIEAIVDAGAEMATIGAPAAAFFAAAGQVLQFLVPCNTDETELSTSKEIDAVRYLGSYCGKKISLGFSKVCIRKDRSYCAWPTPLGKVIMEQAMPQVGRGFGSAKHPNCKGLTIEQVKSLDWDQIDLSEWAGKLMETGNLPGSDFGNFDPGTMQPGSPNIPGLSN